MGRLNDVQKEVLRLVHAEQMLLPVPMLFIVIGVFGHYIDVRVDYEEWPELLAFGDGMAREELTACTRYSFEIDSFSFDEDLPEHIAGVVVREIEMGVSRFISHLERTRELPPRDEWEQVQIFNVHAEWI